MADEPRADWQVCLTVPRNDQDRMRVLVSIHEYLNFASREADFDFTLEEDPDSWHIVWVSARARVMRPPHFNDVVLKVKKDIETLVASFIEKPPKPKSVYEWIRENPYK